MMLVFLANSKPAKGETVHSSFAAGNGLATSVMLMADHPKTIRGVCTRIHPPRSHRVVVSSVRRLLIKDLLIRRMFYLCSTRGNCKWEII